jgi:hypothetical protein
VVSHDINYLVVLALGCLTIKLSFFNYYCQGRDRGGDPGTAARVGGGAVGGSIRVGKVAARVWGGSQRRKRGGGAKREKGGDRGLEERGGDRRNLAYSLLKIERLHVPLYL